MSLKEKFDKLPRTNMLENVVWFHLSDGPAFDAAWEAIRHSETLDKERKHELGHILGQDFGVIRHDKIYGPAVLYPEIYTDPYGSNDLFILSPVGLDVKTKETTFYKAEGGREMSDDETAKLTGSLFLLHSESLPAICRPPLTSDTIKNTPGAVKPGF